MRNQIKDNDKVRAQMLPFINTGIRDNAIIGTLVSV